MKKDLNPKNITTLANNSLFIKKKINKNIQKN